MTVNTPDNVGILHVAIGNEFAEEAKISAQSVRKEMGDIPITLITNIDGDYSIFDNIIKVNNPAKGFEDKIRYIQETPYDKTIYLDTDIYLYDDISELFNLLNRFDIAASYTVNKPHRDFYPLDDTCSAFPEYNTGLIVFKNNQKVDDFFECWWSKWNSESTSEHTHDQPTFRQCLYNSDLRIATLRKEYNCRFHTLGKVNYPVKVFHGHLIDIDTPGVSYTVPIEQVVNKLNESHDPHSNRIYFMLGGRFYVVNFTNILIRFYSSLRDNGVKYTLQRGWSKISSKILSKV